MQISAFIILPTRHVFIAVIERRRKVKLSTNCWAMSQLVKRNFRHIRFGNCLLRSRRWNLLVFNLSYLTSHGSEWRVSSIYCIAALPITKVKKKSRNLSLCHVFSGQNFRMWHFFVVSFFTIVLLWSINGRTPRDLATICCWHFEFLRSIFQLKNCRLTVERMLCVCFEVWERCSIGQHWKLGKQQHICAEKTP